MSSNLKYSLDRLHQVLTSRKLNRNFMNCHVSNKQRNKLQKMYNGNGHLGQNVTLVHWNMGAKVWDKKLLEIETMILQYKGSFKKLKHLDGFSPQWWGGVSG